MVNDDSAAPVDTVLPWLIEPLREALATQRGHALLLHGPQGVGQFEMALLLAQAWLCDAPAQADGRLLPACGRCVSCRLIRAHSHPDLMVLMPEAVRSSLGWGTDDASGEGAAGEVDGTGKRKPSKDIRVAEVRSIVTFAHTTAARDRGKVVVVFPAEAMNTVAANALLKILEEPPGRLRFVLAGANVDALLPTIRSRCQSLRLALPDTAVASAWLASQGVAQPEVLLAATGGQPQDALDWFRDGLDARTWLSLPAQLARGDAAGVQGWPLPRVVDTLFKVCHDAMRAAAGGTPRYFPPGAVAGEVSMTALGHWYRELGRIARHAEHPWQPGLSVQWLVAQAKMALQTPQSAANRAPPFDKLGS